MAKTAEAIIAEVLALPEGERSRVVDALVEAVAATELEQDPAFVAELRRRADAALSGESNGQPWREAMAELHSELDEHRARRKTA
jgi:hypothetical protein